VRSGARLPRVDRLTAEGVLPGYVAALREGDRLEVVHGGSTDPWGGRPTGPGTRYRLSSLSKPFAGLLAAAFLDEGVLSLEDPVTRWLPELGRLTVLPRPDAPLADARPLDEPPTVGHLLTMTSGFGIGVEETPLTRAMAGLGIHPGPTGPAMTEHEFVERLAGLPLAFVPGAGWAYHTSTDVLGLVLGRASGAGPEALLRDRLREPLGLSSPTFAVPAEEDRAPALFHDGDWQHIEPGGPDPEAMPTLSCGLWATAADTLHVLDELARPVTVPARVAAEVRRPRLTDAQRDAAGGFLAPGYSYGYQVSVALGDDPRGPRAGSVGWAGGTGTLGVVDPGADRTSVLLTNRGLEGPRATDALDAFLADVYR
jgi:CubicO group peptidase (beta-lactamase class C family)